MRKLCATMIVLLGLGLGHAGVGGAADEVDGGIGEDRAASMTADVTSHTTPGITPDITSAIAAAGQDVDAGRCDQAYRRLADIDGLESRARLLAGQCRIRQGLYPEALADLDRVRGASDLTSEQVGDIELFRGVALYHLERYTEATAALDEAEGLTGEGAQLALYRGLLALRAGDNENAAPSLESAARLAPAVTEPVASYYAGLAWQGSSENAKARTALERVIALDPDGPWGKEAQKLLDESRHPFYVLGRIGMEYDDNVLLQGGVTQFQPAGTNLGINEDGRKDWRGVWQIEAGTQIWREGDWSAGLIGSYSGNAHVDLKDFNDNYPTVGAYMAHRFDSATTGQIRYQFGHAWVDEDPFLQTHIGELSLSHTWREAGVTIAAADVLWDDVRFQPSRVPNNQGSGGPGSPCIGTPAGQPCSPPGVNERRERNRDGLGIGGAVEHVYRVPLSSDVSEVLEQLEIGGAYRFRYFDSQGDEWEHFAHIFSAAMDFEFPLDISLATRVGYEFRDFQNASTFPNQEIIDEEYFLGSADREEHEVTVEAELEKNLTDNLSVSARWSYLNNESNTRVYDYTRHIVGGYLKFRFD